jgi:large-conductance mechanosensitive channel
MTITPPNIQVVHASDAPQHAGELKTILQRLKEEHRIADFASLDISTNPDSLSFKNDDHQGIIVLLTNEIERARTKIEGLLKNITREKQDIKLIEIIVDNLPYHNNFISFPQDLMPIRSRDDMNLIWSEIEHDLQAIFPKPIVPEVVEPPTTGSKNYLKLIGVAILSLTICFLFLASIAPNVRDEGLTIIGVFTFFLPIIIFLLQKRKLEDQKKLNWRKLLIKTGTALTFFLEMFFVLVIVCLLMGLGFPEIPVALLSVFVMPMILFYRGKTESTNVVDKVKMQSRVKTYLILFGALVLFSILSAVVWLIVVERVYELYSYEGSNVYFEKDKYLTSLTILTTICLLIMTARRMKILPPS